MIIFKKTTTDLFYPVIKETQPRPQGSVVTWINLDGKILNSGLEATLNASIINDGHYNCPWDLGVIATFVRNNVYRFKIPFF